MVIVMHDVTVGAMRDFKNIVVEEVNWAVAEGEFCVVAGAQYSGKSNFLMMTAGLTSPLNGFYKFFGNELRTSDITKHRRPGFVFEGGRLFNHLTIAENVALPLQYHYNLPDAEVESRTQKLLELMGVDWFADSMPPNVSPNWLKRAGLARALTLRPEVLLLDNPLRGLDAHHTQWWLDFLDELCFGHQFLGGKKITVIATTDDLRPWQGSHRRFALLHERKFIPLGGWSEVVAAENPVVKTLLGASLASIIHGNQA